MKKPTPKSDSKKKDDASKHLGKVLDVAKAGMSTLASALDLGKEIERTKQAQINAHVQIIQAQKETERTRSRADVEILAIHRDHHKDRMEHERELERLKSQRANDAALMRQRERVLDKLLDGDSRDNAPLLADSLRALLPNGDHQ
jgi:hypothetical protein